MEPLLSKLWLDLLSISGFKYHTIALVELPRFPTICHLFSDTLILKLSPYSMNGYLCSWSLTLCFCNLFKPAATPHKATVSIDNTKWSRSPEVCRINWKPILRLQGLDHRVKLLWSPFSVLVERHWYHIPYIKRVLAWFFYLLLSRWAARQQRTH
jgi:hypothetical protein